MLKIHPISLRLLFYWFCHCWFLLASYLHQLQLMIFIWNAYKIAWHWILLWPSLLEFLASALQVLETYYPLQKTCTQLTLAANKICECAGYSLIEAKIIHIYSHWKRNALSSRKNCPVTLTGAINRVLSNLLALQHTNECPRSTILSCFQCCLWYSGSC